jgi:hypothetical protein
MELFGGAGGVTGIAIRRHLRGGRNFDLTTGIDLHEPREVEALFMYIAKYTPFVIIMGPPCTAFGSWSNYNRVHNWEGWKVSMNEGLPLARIAARAAQAQIAGNRFFLRKPMGK